MPSYFHVFSCLLTSTAYYYPSLYLLHGVQSIRNSGCDTKFRRSRHERLRNRQSLSNGNPVTLENTHTSFSVYALK
jgi:hypothetical protein